MLDAATGKLLKHVPCENPGDLKVGADGKLYLVCGTTRSPRSIPRRAPLTTVVDGLKAFRCVAADKQGNIYAGLGEPENQVKVFDKAGKLVRAIGKPGGRNLLGPWETGGVRFMAALKIDPNGKLWVMENDSRPRRISVWDAASGAFEKELFGPTDYGAGGGGFARPIPIP